jgi:hypothetical protein
VAGPRGELEHLFARSVAGGVGRALQSRHWQRFREPIARIISFMSVVARSLSRMADAKNDPTSLTVDQKCLNLFRQFVHNADVTK